MTNTSKEKALEAIRNLHSDTSVSLEETKDFLEEVSEELLMMIEAVNADLENQSND